MLIKLPRKRAVSLEQPLLHLDHGKPKTRREFISQGFMAGTAAVSGASLFSLLAAPRRANAFSQQLKDDCGIRTTSSGKVPFICFDLAGGANIAGSNVLMGKSGGQEDFLSTAGYNKLGLPGDMLPGQGFINEEFGLKFHSDSGFLRGLLDTVSVGARANIDGSIIAARSENDTGNNPHNPMYGILKAGADGELLSLVGSQSSESGGNSMAPMSLINPQARPTKVDRPSDVTGLVDVGDLTAILSQADAVEVMKSMREISVSKMANASPGFGAEANDDIRQRVDCGYVKSADLAERFGNPEDLDPSRDDHIVGDSGIFSTAEFTAGSREGREFRKTASVMKLVQNGYAGAGTVTLGGYDYHTGERATGESRDYLAGRCMGACLEYAHRLSISGTPTPLMLYVFSDGSVSSNGRIDDTEGGRGKGEWTGDNQQTAASFYLVYNPSGRPVVRNRQIGWMRADASVETASSPAANNVNQLVQTVVLNYMALNNEIGEFGNLFPGHGLGNADSLDRLIGIEPLA
ncbi:general secretion pathway protein GspF [Marinobacter sp. CHS3-4]|uniref:general secretion pathway protein GspF n=1 Tax=Marinobacter sp. CHS3-4 TaxID=3045174 RepID=UPI0024B53434|nr:general secretion pathway protein GspF [Marinobacter sp. CHS3-4]MDI9245750.1 general secretion pathway protein GspF [Marinobacter sp. CHS3-4]